MQNLALGIDIGGTKILTALVDPQGRVVREWRTPTEASRGGEAVMASVEAAIAHAQSELSAEERAALAGIGVSSAGQVDHEHGRITYASPNIPGWSGTPLGELLKARFGLPVVVDNDANAAAYGEWWVGAGRGVDDLVMVTVGTGIGGGVVQGGKLLRGASWRGGEIGHIVINADGPRCNCGQPGCLELYASGTAIAHMAREARPGWEPSGPDVFAAAEAGDELAEQVLARAVRYLALGLVSITSVVDPRLFLLGGGVATQPSYLPRLRRVLADPQVVGQRGFDTERVRLAQLGESAGAVGAAGELLHALGRISTAG